jgi:prevent-host-death family protein
MKVGVRELKAHLSEYLDRAAAGDVIEVTDRGRPKAVLGPVQGAAPRAHVVGYPLSAEAEARVRASIAEGIRGGWITPGNGEPPVFPTRRFTISRSIQEILDEDRGE